MVDGQPPAVVDDRQQVGVQERLAAAELQHVERPAQRQKCFQVGQNFDHGPVAAAGTAGETDWAAEIARPGDLQQGHAGAVGGLRAAAAGSVGRAAAGFTFPDSIGKWPSPFFPFPEEGKGRA